MARKLALITGGNVGIGFAAAQQLLARGTHDVVIACRNGGDEAAARLAAGAAGASAAAMVLDLASLESVRAFGAAFRERHPGGLDLLICNAGLGASFVGGERQSTADGFELTVGTNHLGHFALVHQLLPSLHAAAKARGGARVVCVASKLHFKGQLLRSDCQLAAPGAYSGSAAYNNSKLMNVLFALALHERYAGAGITVNAVHPGFIPVSSFLRNQPGFIRGLLKGVVYPLGRVLGFTATVAAGAAAELAAADAPQGGCYIDQLKGVRTPAAAALDKDSQQWLWAESERLTGCSYPASL